MLDFFGEILGVFLDPLIDGIFDSSFVGPPLRTDRFIQLNLGTAPPQASVKIPWPEMIKLIAGSAGEFLSLGFYTLRK